MIVLALPGAAALAADLAGRLACPWSQLATHRFPDGESLVRIDAPVQDRCVVLVGSLDHPDGKTLPLLFAADAARELGAERVGLVAPYLAYMRQDMRFHPGEAVTSRSYARLLSGALDFLVTVDPHLHRWHALGDIYSIRTQAVAAAPAIARWLRDQVPQPLLVGPDAESAQWIAHVAHLCSSPWTVMEKTRSGDREVRVAFAPDNDWTGRTPVLLDDVVSTGGTMVAAVRAIAAAGLGPPVCVATHALLDDEALDALRDAGATRFVSCDSVPHSSNAIALGPLLADAVRALARPSTSSR
ncbi:ribose-phosphate diphosphokinase [Caenimonas sedimenti]|uniref:Ribose-phosphate diphosphokinase n=1 Tax=Caenimonas sedimenti TaxID=2596921 RepID=A0A562ZX39_9BURK|nr:ribose-phosphate diphosphokinase [Caenimonas sedimenti]TWO72704.1 ribose-phosphate diphosphokinase [Caenimonas sedimenti]